MAAGSRRSSRICSSNAATYSPPNTKVALSVTARDREIALRVQDHGDGIAPDLLPHIFDLFVQSEQKLDRARGGLGLGLSLAKTIVDLHGGTIGARSDGPGKGSEFEVRLPVGELAALPVAAVPVVGLSGPCRIVLVDDQEDSREMLKVLFEARNHVVYDGEDGAHAIQLVAEHRPDVAFIDIGLPVMNGFEVAQQIRRHPELKDVILVALTGYGNTQDVQRALAAGFDMHVTKPAELKTLEQILARARSGLKRRSSDATLERRWRTVSRSSSSRTTRVCRVRRVDAAQPPAMASTIAADGADRPRARPRRAASMRWSSTSRCPTRAVTTSPARCAASCSRSRP